MDSILQLQGDSDSTLTPLILVHAISGLALPYLALGPLSDPNDDRPIYGISSPAYGSKTYRLPLSLDEVAKQYVALVRRNIQSSGPFLLGGWSMGGMIATRMAEILEEQGETVLHVIMIDSGNPEVYPPFKSRMEHDLVSDGMFSQVAERMNLPAGTLEGDGDESNQSSDEEDEDLSIMLSQMRKHIHNGLKIVSGTKARPSNKRRLAASATLIKCTTPTAPSPRASDARKAFVRDLFRDETLGWKDSQFKKIRTLSLRAQHDGVFDKAPVQHLTRLVRGVLTQIDS